MADISGKTPTEKVTWAGLLSQAFENFFEDAGATITTPSGSTVPTLSGIIDYVYGLSEPVTYADAATREADKGNQNDGQVAIQSDTGQRYQLVDGEWEEINRSFFVDVAPNSIPWIFAKGDVREVSFGNGLNFSGGALSVDAFIGGSGSPSGVIRALTNAQMKAFTSTNLSADDRVERYCHSNTNDKGRATYRVLSGNVASNAATLTSMGLGTSEDGGTVIESDDGEWTFALLIPEAGINARVFASFTSSIPAATATAALQACVDAAVTAGVTALMPCTDYFIDINAAIDLTSPVTIRPEVAGGWFKLNPSTWDSSTAYPALDVQENAGGSDIDGLWFEFDGVLPKFSTTTYFLGSRLRVRATAIFDRHNTPFARNKIGRVRAKNVYIGYYVSPDRLVADYDSPSGATTTSLVLPDELNDLANGQDHYFTGWLMDVRGAANDGKPRNILTHDASTGVVTFDAMNAAPNTTSTGEIVLTKYGVTRKHTDYAAISGSTTTTLTLTSDLQAHALGDDYFVGWYIQTKRSDDEGDAKLITAYDHSTGVVTFEAMDQAPDTRSDKTNSEITLIRPGKIAAEIDYLEVRDADMHVLSPGNIEGLKIHKLYCFNVTELQGPNPHGVYISGDGLYSECADIYIGYCYVERVWDGSCLKFRRVDGLTIGTLEFLDAPGGIALGQCTDVSIGAIKSRRCGQMDRSAFGATIGGSQNVNFGLIDITIMKGYDHGANGTNNLRPVALIVTTHDEEDATLIAAARNISAPDIRFKCETEASGGESYAVRLKDGDEAENIDGVYARVTRFAGNDNSKVFRVEQGTSGGNIRLECDCNVENLEDGGGDINIFHVEGGNTGVMIGYDPYINDLPRIDDGTNTRRYIPGGSKVIYTSDQATINPATVNDWAPTYIRQNVSYTDDGEYISGSFDLRLNANDYTTADGDLTIDLGLGDVVASADNASWPCEIVPMANVTYTNPITGRIVSSDNEIKLFTTASNGSLSELGVAAIPAATSNVQITGRFRFRKA